MEKPLISVIVPIYMIDRYIGLCIESIMNQTYANLEIILVDDGGKDRCPEICDLYASKDDRIKVVHKSNGGLVSARKAGLHQANGEYVSYVDGDDWIEEGFIETLFAAADKYGADAVCAGFTRDLFTQSVKFCNALPSGTYVDEELRGLWKSMLSFDSFYRPGISTYVWNKLFKRELLLDVQLRVDNRISIGEDAAVTYPYLLRCKTVSVIEDTSYHYRQREDSMLKQSMGYLTEAQKIRYLYDYMRIWAEKSPAEIALERQVTDYVLSVAIMRFGGQLPHDEYSTFDRKYYDKDVVVYSAGTFGQQLMKRFKETQHCRVVSWIDDDYWEYRRCCLDVDSVESIRDLNYDYILIATVDKILAEKITERLICLGASQEKILTATVPLDRKRLVECFVDVNSITGKENGGILSHA